MADLIFIWWTRGCLSLLPFFLLFFPSSPPPFFLFTKPVFWFPTLTPVVNYQLLKMFSPVPRVDPCHHISNISRRGLQKKYNGDKGNSNITITRSVHVCVYMNPRIQITFTWQEHIQLKLVKTTKSSLISRNHITS